MPSTSQLEAATRQFLDDFEANYASASTEWLWKHISDSEKFSHCDVSGAVFLGRKEVQPVVEAWSKYGQVTHEIVGPITALPGLFGPTSLVYFQDKMLMERLPAPEMPNVTTWDTFILFDANCKVVRFQQWPGDDNARLFAAELEKYRGSLQGRPDDVFFEALVNYKQALEVVADGTIESMASICDDNIEYITETGAVITGKTAYLSFISAVYDLASVKRVVPVDTIHTPDPHTAWALVTIEFKDASILPEDAKDHLIAVHGIRFGPNGKAVRIFKLGTSLERYKTTAKFFDFVRKRREEVANVGTGA